MNQQQEIRHQEAVIEKLRSFNREKSIKRAESREKMLNKMTVVEKPLSDVQEIHFSLEPSCVSGNDVLSVEELSKQYDGQTLFPALPLRSNVGSMWRSSAATEPARPHF